MFITDKQTKCGNPYNERSFSNKIKGSADTCYNMDEPKYKTLLCERSQSQRQNTVNFHFYMKFPE